MKRARGFTLIELLIVIAIVGIFGAIVLQGYLSYAERKNCKHGHAEPTGAIECTNSMNGRTSRCVPETKFVCDEYYAETP